MNELNVSPATDEDIRRVLDMKCHALANEVAALIARIGHERQMTIDWLRETQRAIAELASGRVANPDPDPVGENLRTVAHAIQESEGCTEQELRTALKISSRMIGDLLIQIGVRSE